ncbi:MAG: MFS transporter [Rhodospirillales bacterium]|nr:MFS transporter [Rhodospirillales bacterium]MDE2199586.1 MFS transporter [Rhodospirillales bacterium]MDE2575321.1 MFS transporter [Rhodospirillales bacterium]
MADPPPGAAPILNRTRLTALIVACALFMQNLDSTVISTALPTMARAFRADPTHMSVALTSYLLSLAVFIPASGWMADRYGTRTIFRAAIAIFTVGSVLCGLSFSLTTLVLARIFQGIGGAMMVPVGRLVLLRSVAKSELVAAMAWLTVPALIGPVIGPPLGGFIVTWFSWRWIFYINIPIGVLGVALVTWFVADVREPGGAPFDFRGLAMTGIGLACLMFGLETAGRGLVSPALTGAMIGAGLLACLAYWAHARRHAAPLLDFTLMRIPTFAVSVVSGSLFRTGVGAIPFLLPLMLQIGFGRTAAQSGLITFASSAGAILMKPAAMSALRRLGFRDTLVANGVLSALLLAGCAAFRPAWPVAFIYAVLLSGGFFRSLQFTAYNALAYADVPRERMSAATSLYSTIQQVSLTVGISGGAAALEIAMASSGHLQPMVGDFSVAFLVVAMVSLTGAPLALMMPRNAATEMSGHPGHMA